MGFPTVVCVLLLSGVFLSALADKHSLYYIYTALSKDVKIPGIYDFTALGLLDDREIDYYSSKDQVKVPKQDWMREKMQEDYWEKGTQSRKSKEQWFKVNVGILKERMRHNDSDLHVLQWRHGCEVDTQSNGSAVFVKGVDEYSYDGSEFLSFDDKNMRWIAPVPAAEPTKKKWDGVDILNQYTKGYLTNECVDWLTKFMGYGEETLKKHSPPDVHVFATKSVIDPNKLKLTCLATGFYPKDVVMNLRKYRTSLPDHLLTSSGVRPNEDETFQLRKSVEIQEGEKASYDCFVSHSSLPTSIISKWDGRCKDCKEDMALGFILGILLTMIVVGVVTVVVVIVLKKKGVIGNRNNSRSNSSRNGLVGYSPAPAELTSVAVNPPATEELTSVAVNPPATEEMGSVSSNSSKENLTTEPDQSSDSGKGSVSSNSSKENLKTEPDQSSDSGNVTPGPKPADFDSGEASSDGSANGSADSISASTSLLGNDTDNPNEEAKDQPQQGEQQRLLTSSS